MRKVYRIQPYKPASESAKKIAEALGGLRLKYENSKWKPNAKNHNIVVNWGSRNEALQRFDAPELNCILLNKPANVSLASDKLRAFKTMREAGVPIPKFTERKEDTLEWLARGRKVVCRTVLNGNSGKGIVLVDNQNDLVDAPLYTEYFPKKDEFRVHVMNGKVIFVQRKARNRDIPDHEINWQIRNHDNGFIFAHKDLVVPEAVEANAIMAVAALGLDFGAVDLAVNLAGDVRVFEVNTACGLEGTTLEKYVEAFKEY